MTKFCIRFICMGSIEQHSQCTSQISIKFVYSFVQHLIVNPHKMFCRLYKTESCSYFAQVSSSASDDSRGDSHHTVSQTITTLSLFLLTNGDSESLNEHRYLTEKRRLVITWHLMTRHSEPLYQLPNR